MLRYLKLCLILKTDKTTCRHGNGVNIIIIGVLVNKWVAKNQLDFSETAQNVQNLGEYPARVER